MERLARLLPFRQSVVYAIFASWCPAHLIEAATLGTPSLFDSPRPCRACRRRCRRLPRVFEFGFDTPNRRVAHRCGFIRAVASDHGRTDGRRLPHD